MCKNYPHVNILLKQYFTSCPTLHGPELEYKKLNQRRLSHLTTNTALSLDWTMEYIQSPDIKKTVSDQAHN